MDTPNTDRYFLVRIPSGVRVQSHISAYDDVDCIMTAIPCSMLYTLPGYTPAMRAEDERQIAAWNRRRTAPSVGERKKA